MSPETINAIKEALQPVAEKIGQGAAYGWEVVVRQQYIEGLAGVVFGGLGVIITLVVFLTFWKMAHGYVKRGGDSEMYLGIFFLGGLSVFAIVSFAIWMYGSTLQLLNPAYYALQFFISLGTK